MRGYRDILKSLVLRALLAAPFFAAGTVCLSGGLTEIAGLVLFVVGAAIIALPVARLLGGLFGFLYYPHVPLNRPLPVYSLVESRVAQGRYEEAMQLYEEIAADYPGEVRPYLDMLHIAAVHLKDTERARGFYHRGLQSVKKPEDAHILTGVYVALRGGPRAGHRSDPGADADGGMPGAPR